MNIYWLFFASAATAAVGKLVESINHWMKYDVRKYFISFFSRFFFYFHRTSIWSISWASPFMRFFFFYHALAHNNLKARKSSHNGMRRLCVYNFSIQTINFSPFRLLGQAVSIYTYSKMLRVCVCVLKGTSHCHNFLFYPSSSSSLQFLLLFFSRTFSLSSNNKFSHLMGFTMAPPV